MRELEDILRAAVHVHLQRTRIGRAVPGVGWQGNDRVGAIRWIVHRGVDIRVNGQRGTDRKGICLLAGIAVIDDQMPGAVGGRLQQGVDVREIGASVGCARAHSAQKVPLWRNDLIKRDGRGVPAIAVQIKVGRKGVIPPAQSWMRFICRVIPA